MRCCSSCLSVLFIAEILLISSTSTDGKELYPFTCNKSFKRELTFVNLYLINFTKDNVEESTFKN